jgi:hypothetical protein
LLQALEAASRANRTTINERVAGMRVDPSGGWGGGSAQSHQWYGVVRSSAAIRHQARRVDSAHSAQ